MNTKVLVLTLVAVNEFLHGFALSFCAFITLKYIFLRKTGRFIPFSLCLGALISVVITTGLLLSKESGIDATWIIYGFVVLMILLGWLILTNRSPDSLISTAFAVAFSECTLKCVEKIIFSVIALFILNYEISMWSEFIGYIIIYLLSPAFIIFLKFIAGNKEREPLSKWNMLLLTGSVAGIVILVENKFMFSENVSDVNPIAVIPISVTFLFIASAVLLAVRSSQAQYYRKINHLNQEYLAIQANHFEKVRDSDVEMRRLRHDMKNHIMCMNELCKSEKYDELKEYLSHLSDRVTEISYVVRTGNEIADAIINEKTVNAREYGIRINVDGNFREINIPAIDLCTILSNLLDNAIEAVKKLAEADRKISILTGRAGNFIFVSIKNNVVNPVELSDNLKTSKSDRENHGFGIENVKRAVSKCGGEMKLNCNRAENGYEFTAEVMLPRIY